MVDKIQSPCPHVSHADGTILIDRSGVGWTVTRDGGMVERPAPGTESNVESAGVTWLAAMRGPLRCVVLAGDGVAPLRPDVEKLQTVRRILSGMYVQVDAEHTKTGRSFVMIDGSDYMSREEAEVMRELIVTDDCDG